MGRISITCPGCGQVLAVSPDNPRAEIECLWCGTKMPVAASQASPSPPRPQPSPSAPAAQAAPAKKAEEPPASEPRWFEQPGYNLQGAPGVPSSLNLELPDTRSAISSADRSRPAPSSLSEDEDSAAYQLDASPERPCPECANPLPGNAVLCPACGFDQTRGTRARRSYQPIRKNWDAGWPLAQRVRLFLIGQAIILPLGVLGAITLGHPTAFVAPWLVFSALTAFLLGTYARTDLTRSERGKVQLQQTWRVCFVPRPTETIRRSEYEGITSGKAPAADFWDWVVLICLALCGIVLGVLWWYFMVRRDSFYVALTRDHGFPERTLYWGWDEQQAKDMARTIDDVAFAVT